DRVFLCRAAAPIRLETGCLPLCRRLRADYDAARSPLTADRSQGRRHRPRPALPRAAPGAVLLHAKAALDHCSINDSRPSPALARGAFLCAAGFDPIDGMLIDMLAAI